MTPENSAPAMKGKGGWCWYLPLIWRRSKKFVLAAWIWMVYWSGSEVGSETVETVRPEGS